MPDTILDGTGGTYVAEVNDEHRLLTDSVSQSIQHHVSHKEEGAFQVIGTATLSSGTVVALHIKNTSTTHHIIATYIRHQILSPAGGTSFPNASNYFRIAAGRTYASGGATVTPVNVHVGSSKVALATCYGSGPTLAGTATDIDRWYTKAAGDMNTFNKEGSLILKPNKTLELSYVGDRSSGTIYVRLSFLYEEFLK